MGNGEDTSILNRPHNYYNHPASNYGKVFATDSIGLAFAIIVVALRCYSKFHITKTPGWEDYTLILALATYIAFCSCNFVQGGRYGAGRHSWDLPPELYNGYLTVSAVHIGTCLMYRSPTSRTVLLLSTSGSGVLRWPRFPFFSFSIAFFESISSSALHRGLLVSW